MIADERRNIILNIISNSEKPISGSELADKLSVSRQIIVQDIALLKAAGHKIISTNKGYVLNDENSCQRVFKTYHTTEQTKDELTAIIDLGGTVVNVFVWHRVYGKVQANLNISSRRNVLQCIEGLESGKSKPLMNITSGYHYHTVKADSEETLDLIEKALDKLGFLVPEIY